MVQWIDIGLVTPSIAQALSAGVNLVFLRRYARTTSSAARRIASTSLGLICAVLCLEAVLFFGFAWQRLDGAPTPALFATLLMRWALAFATLLLSALIWRSPLRRS